MNDLLPQPAAAAKFGLPPAVFRFLSVLIGLTALCLGIEAFCAFALHLPYPYDWPLQPWQDPFRDFYLYKPRYAFFHSPAFFTFQGPDYMYPAPAALVYAFFYSLPHSTRVFLVTIALSALTAALIFASALREARLSISKIVVLICIVLLCSYPFFFEFEQANIEIILWIIVSSGLWAFFRGHGYTAAVCFGLAAAIKIYPLIFIGLFLSRRQWRPPLVAVLVCAFTTLAGLWAVCPNLAVSSHGIQQGIATFRQQYMLHNMARSFDHSLFGLLKSALDLSAAFSNAEHLNSPETLARMLSLYLPIAALCGVALFIFRIRKLPMVNQVLCLTIASILLPPVSYDYTLIHLYAPWAMLVLLAIERREHTSQALVPVFVCFAILFAPESEIAIADYGLGGQTKAVTLIVLFILALRYRLPSSFDRPALAPA